MALARGARAVDDAGCQLPLDCAGDLRITWVHRADYGGGPDHVVLKLVQGLGLPRRAGSTCSSTARPARPQKRGITCSPTRVSLARGASISPYWRSEDIYQEWCMIKGERLIDGERGQGRFWGRRVLLEGSAPPAPSRPWTEYRAGATTTRPPDLFSHRRPGDLRRHHRRVPTRLGPRHRLALAP